MLIVTGGNDGQVDLDSTEVLDFNHGSWRSLQRLSVILLLCKMRSDQLKKTATNAMLQWSCQVCTEFARTHFWSRRHFVGRGFPRHWRLAGAMSICQHPSFFLAFITKLLMGRVCSLVCVSLCPLQQRKVWRHLSQCAFSFFLCAGTPPRDLDKKKQNINKVLKTHNGQWTHRELDEQTRYLPGMQ